MIGLLIAQAAVAGLAAVVFQVGLDSRIAGLIAGSAFVAVGIYGARVGWKARSVGVSGYIIFFMALVHLLGIAIPILGFRLLNWEQPFSKVAVWGLSGPDFHALSTKLYGVWMLFTGAAWWNLRRK